MVISAEEKVFDLPIRSLFYRDDKFVFFLTGSRYFGGSTEKSDYDFFAQHSDELMKALEQTGFHILSTYFGDSTGKLLGRDPDIVEVARYQGESLRGPFSIDVQLVHNFERRKKITELLYHSGLMPKIPKEDRPAFWSMAYSLYLSGPGQPKRGIFGGRS